MADTADTDLSPEATRHARYNYVVHAAEGGLFMGGLAFVSFTTVMPTIVRSLGGADWLVALMPVMLPVGLLLPPIFTAHRIERLRRYMPLLLGTGAFQRLPYLAAALALIYLAEARPRLVLALVAVGPLLSGIACGVSLPAWQQLLLRTVPKRRRSSLFAVRYVLASAAGLVAGWVVKTALEAYPGPSGYGILHLCTLGMLAAGYATFALVREAPFEPPAGHKPLTLRQNLRGIPALVRREKRVKQYMVARALLSGVFIMMPFLAIYARERLGETEAYLGQLLIVQTVGAILGNVVGGVLGDRVGGKAVVLVSQVSFLVLSGWSAVASTDLEFQAIFLVFGFALMTMNIGSMTLSLEICPLRQRSTYLAVISFACMASMLVAVGVSALVWTGPERFVHLAVLTGVTVAASLVLLLPLRDPRREPAPAA